VDSGRSGTCAVRLRTAPFQRQPSDLCKGRAASNVPFHSGAVLHPKIITQGARSRSGCRAYQRTAIGPNRFGGLRTPEGKMPAVKNARVTPSRREFTLLRQKRLKSMTLTSTPISIPSLCRRRRTGSRSQVGISEVSAENNREHRRPHLRPWPQPTRRISPVTRRPAPRWPKYGLAARGKKHPGPVFI
jgi:hypothetical protein